MINNFKGHPVLDGPLSLVMFFWPSSRSMHGAKNRILGNHRIFHERGQGSRPNSIYVKQTLFFLIGNCFRTNIIQKWRILDPKWLKKTKNTHFELIWSLHLHILLVKRSLFPNLRLFELQSFIVRPRTILNSVSGLVEVPWFQNKFQHKQFV